MVTASVPEIKITKKGAADNVKVSSDFWTVPEQFLACTLDTTACTCACAAVALVEIFTRTMHIYCRLLPLLTSTSTSLAKVQFGQPGTVTPAVFPGSTARCIILLQLSGWLSVCPGTEDACKSPDSVKIIAAELMSAEGCWW